MGRKILFITTDQMRYDALGCNGGTVARTPVVDGLAADGIRYQRAHPQNVVCMPSRATMITGQHVGTHGVWMNGVALPVDAPSVARVLHRAGYRTALVGKAHFEPFIDPFLRFPENVLGRDADPDGSHAPHEGEPHRGFDHLQLATHGTGLFTHYADWMGKHAPGHIADFYSVVEPASMEVSSVRGGDTDCVQVGINNMPRGVYHTDWCVDRAIDWLDTLDPADDWFCWVSFPDPHHPWDPPQSEMSRVRWRDLDLPEGYPADRSQREALLDAKAPHWRQWYDGALVSNYEAPRDWVPATLTDDQVREVNARVHVENELIDEGVGRLLAHIDGRGWGDDTDVLFTTDHGEFQGDHGLLFKGPYHVDSLMRLPLIWRPARSSGPVTGVSVAEPVGLVDLAPTFCAIAGVEVPEWMEGQSLPRDESEAAVQKRQRVLTEWDSVHPNRTKIGVRSIWRDGFLCTSYLAGTVHDGTEGELYDCAEDPLQRINLWDDPARRSIRDDLVADLWVSLPPMREPRPIVQAPV
ncbi:MAG TPA: sulfatase-like hydrolase/transferase [Acidimicrobiales bacterium]|jgi:arylsulfatase A-like enzyme